MDQASTLSGLAAPPEKRRHIRILVVEDQRDLGDQIGRTLTETGYQVIHVANGEEALRALDPHPPHLLILDWMLPDTDGIQILQHFRRRSMAPVLMISGQARAMDRVLGLELGADDYLAKPFSLAELNARVRALLRRAAQQQGQRSDDRQPKPQVLRHGPLQVDPFAHEVRLSDMAVNLTKTEFRLLQLLMQHPGRAFSRQYLLETLWTDVVAGCDRSVDNAILRLRKKLAPWSGHIETLWGVGYRLKTEDLPC